MNFVYSKPQFSVSFSCSGNGLAESMLDLWNQQDAKALMDDARAEGLSDARELVLIKSFH